MIEFNRIAKKWQDRWEKAKLFEANPDNRKKFFVNFPYPYINAYQHIGHMFTLMRVEAFARFKRLKGFNVLFPQGWHATGSPIVNASKRVKAKEEKQIKIMKDMGFSDNEIKKFEKPEYWIEFFAPEFEKDYRSVGMSVDWRRKFHTTSLNPHYDKFIKWQFRKLKEKGYVIKGKFPVVWDPVDGCAVGDHARIEGEGETAQEFCLFKFKLDDGRNIITATLRPDTVMGITNVYVDPDETYKEIEVKNERWIVGEPMINKLKLQEFEVKEIGDVDGSSLINQKVETCVKTKILVLPATFLDSKYGTGIVHSVPSDSADDLIALQNLQEDKKLINKYNLNAEEVRSIKPIAVFDTPEIGDNPAQYFLDKYKVKSQNDRNKLDKIKKELYKLTFNKSTLNKKYKQGFSRDLSGKLVKDSQELIKKELKENGAIETFYELTGKVVSRSLTECVVKIVDNQWFMNYADEDWKKQTHKCLKNLKLYPEKSRQQFEYVIDWLHEWACTREEGLGTKLPWDEKWLIESLSDSTIYMAYYTIAHLITKIPIEKVDDEFFDYVLLGEGKKPKIPEICTMRKNFDYYYPVDFRNSGKDLIQNHLTFFMFNHVALFPEDKWPKGIGVNGWVNVDGQKMSKSLGNMIPVREIVEKYSADAARITILNGGEEMDDPNWDSEFAKSIGSKLNGLYEFCTKNYGKFKRTEKRPIDIWFESELNKIIKNSEEAMELTLFRTAIQHIYFNMQKTLKHYMKRSNDDPRKDLMDEFIEAQLIMLTSFCPHICEEIWEAIGKKGFISEADWPKFDLKKINEEASASEEGISTLIADIRKVMELIKIDKPKNIKLIISPKWKYDFFSLIKGEIENTRNVGELIKKCMANNELKKYGKDISKIIPSIIKDPSKMPKVILSQKKEMEGLKNSISDIKDKFNSEVALSVAEESNEQKAKIASPGKPTILIE